MAQERVCPACGSALTPTGFACGGPGTIGCAERQAINANAEVRRLKKAQLTATEARAPTATQEQARLQAAQMAAPVTTKLVINKGKGKQPWYWKPVARNGETLAHSEGFTRRSDGIRAAVDFVNAIGVAFGAEALSRSEMLARGLVVAPKRG